MLATHHRLSHLYVKNSGFGRAQWQSSENEAAAESRGGEKNQRNKKHKAQLDSRTL